MTRRSRTFLAGQSGQVSPALEDDSDVFDDDGFSTRCGGVGDRVVVAWQLNLE